MNDCRVLLLNVVTAFCDRSFHKILLVAIKISMNAVNKIICCWHRERFEIMISLIGNVIICSRLVVAGGNL